MIINANLFLYWYREIQIGGDSMISKQEYNALHISAKAEILWGEGVFVCEVVDYGKIRLCIYELYNFYVGVYYDLNENKIDNIEVLESTLKEILLKHICLN